MDLSKAFDTINYDPLITKLYAYGLRETFLKLLKDYVSNRSQRINVNGTYTTKKELLIGYLNIHY